MEMPESMAQKTNFYCRTEEEIDGSGRITVINTWLKKMGVFNSSKYLVGSLNDRKNTCFQCSGQSSSFSLTPLLYLMRPSFINNNVKQYSLPGRVPAVFFQKYFPLLSPSYDWAEVTQLAS